MLTYTQGWSTRSASFKALQNFITKLIASNQQNVILSAAKNLDIKAQEILHFVQDDTREKPSTRYEFTQNKDRINNRCVSLEVPEEKLVTLIGDNASKKVVWFYLLIIFWVLFALVTPTSLLGEETIKESKEHSQSKPNFVLTIKEDLISLNAKDASLVEVIEEIGNRMKIDVITKIPEEKKIITKFDNFSVENAIERLREFADIAYIKDSDKEKGKITKMLVFPKGKGEELSKSGVSGGEEYVEEAPQTEPQEEEAFEEETPRPEPFKFEFDPSKFEEGK